MAYKVLYNHIICTKFYCNSNSVQEYTEFTSGVYLNRIPVINVQMTC